MIYVCVYDVYMYSECVILRLLQLALKLIWLCSLFTHYRSRYLGDKLLP